MGELLCPLPGAGLCGGSLPREAPGGTTPVSATSSGILYSAPAVTREQSNAGPGGSGAGPLICSALDRSVLGVLGPLGLCLYRGRPNPGLCPVPCAPGPALLDSRSQLYSHLTVEPPPELLQVAPRAPHPTLNGASSVAGGAAAKLLLGRANTSVQSCHLSPSELLPSQCMCPAALRELAALSWECMFLLVSQGALGHPRLPGVLL